MDTRDSIQNLIKLSMSKLNLMKEKSQLLEDQTYFTENEAATEIDAIEKIKSTLEEKLLALDIEFLKFYDNVLQREGISKLSDIDVTEHPSLSDLKSTVSKIKSLEEDIGTTEQMLEEAMHEHHETLGKKMLVKKQGSRVSDVYKKHIQHKAK